MKYLLIENEKGKYTKNNKRYNLLECEFVAGPRANDFKEFESLSKAVENYGLKEVQDENKRL